jgi:hypothetical protein
LFASHVGEPNLQHLSESLCKPCPVAQTRALQHASPPLKQQQQQQQSGSSFSAKTTAGLHPVAAHSSVSAAIDRGVDTEDIEVRGLDSDADDEGSVPDSKSSDGNQSGEESEGGAPAAPNMGAGWLSGAAGRLADLSTPRNHSNLKVCMPILVCSRVTTLHG